MPIPVPIDLPPVDNVQIVIDARADEAAWSNAVEITDFIAFRPKPGVPSSQQTKVLALATEESLYLHFSATDAHPEAIQAGYGRRDSRRNDDYVGILLDMLGTGERGNLFIVNPLGVQLDGTTVRGRDHELIPWRSGWSSWDARWDSAGRIHDSGYDVEIQIPWSAVRHPEEVNRLGILAFRRISRTAEMSSWPALDPSIQGTLVQTAPAGGPGSIASSSNITVQPELTFTQTPAGPPADRLGFGGLAPGGTVRIDPTPALQILATLNPDFSNVESDQAKIEVNSRYSLRYEEKRPFFLEGQEWFTHPIRNLVYTRSMVAPIAGVRATAETAGLTVAALNVLDQSPAPSVSEGRSWSDKDVDGHQALSSVGRVRYSFGRDHMVGAVVSDKQILNTANRHHLLGVDGRWGVSDRITLQAAALGSSTHGAGQDGTFAPALTARKQIRTRHWKNEVHLKYLDAEFRTENGFEPIADWMSITNETEFHVFPSSGMIPRVFLTPVETEAAWRTNGDPRLYDWSPGGGFWTNSGLMIQASGEFKGEEFADQWFETQSLKFMGGGSLTQWLRMWVKGKTGESLLYDADDPLIGIRHGIWTDISIQPARSIRIAPQLGWERFEDDGVQVYDGLISRVKMEFFATPTLWARLISDQSSFSGSQSYEALLAWEKTPGRAIYIGGHTAIVHGPEDDPVANPERQWTAFSKVSWVFER